MDWHDAAAELPPLYEPVWLFHSAGRMAGEPCTSIALVVLTRDGSWVSVTAEAPQVEYHGPLAWALLEKPSKPRQVPARWEPGE